MPPKKAKAAPAAVAAGGGGKGKAKGKGKGKGKGDKKKKASGATAADVPAAGPPEDPVLKEYASLDLAKLEEVVAQLQARLEAAQREHRHAQIEKDAASAAYRRLEGQLAATKAALGQEAEAAEALGWRHKLELRAFSDKATALQHHHERRLRGVAEQQAELVRGARDGQEAAEARWAARWAARKAEAREGTRAVVEDGAAALEHLEGAQREELTALRRQLEGELQALKGDCLDRLARASHTLALRHKVEVHALEERRDQHLHDLTAAHQAALGQMHGYYKGIIGEQVARVEGLEQEVATLRARSAQMQAVLKRLSEEAEGMVEPLAAVTAREAELQTVLKQQAQTDAAVHRAKSRLRFLRHQHQALRVQIAEAQRALAAAEREREELGESAEAGVRRVEAEHARKSRELEARIQALEEEFAATGEEEGGGDD